MTEFESNTSLEPIPAEESVLLYEPAPPRIAVIFSFIALGCGIASLCTLWYGLEFAIAGLVFAMLSKKRTGGKPLLNAKRGKTLSIIGIVISSIWTILYVLYSMQDIMAQLDELMTSLP